MKANEFVKKFGWGEAQKCLPYCSKRGDFIYYKNIEVNFNDLKRLVESHELVESHGGITGSRKELANLCDSLIDCAHLCDSLIDCVQLCQAIADVESC